jgi:hypothetical protein
MVARFASRELSAYRSLWVEAVRFQTHQRVSPRPRMQRRLIQETLHQSRQLRQERLLR